MKAGCYKPFIAATHIQQSTTQRTTMPIMTMSTATTQRLTATQWHPTNNNMVAASKNNMQTGQQQ